MVRSTTERRLLITAMGGLLALGSLLVPSAAVADESCSYAAPVVTTTNLEIALPEVTVGADESATVQVSSGSGTPTGTVTLKVEGVATYTLTLHNGTAQQALPTDLAPGTYQVSASFVDGDCFLPSGDNGTYKISPSEVLGNEGNNRPPATVLGAEASGGLPSTGLSTSTELLALLGLGLLVAGGATVALRRR